MKILSNVHVQVINRPDNTGWSEVRSVEGILHHLGRVAAYDAAAEVTVRFRSCNNRVTVVFGANTGTDIALIMRGTEYYDSIIDAVHFRKQVEELLDTDDGAHYSVIVPVGFLHVHPLYRR